MPPADDHTEADLHRGLLAQLRAFLIELGRDFALDLLFFHRGLNCLVAIELKVDRFEPEHLGKLNFYLEAPGHATCASRTRTRALGSRLLFRIDRSSVGLADPNGPCSGSLSKVRTTACKCGAGNPRP